ncbi:hypothetical protein L7F22_023529 [Adiantum nelumboides]|nr:hypothetical protein [Adiantum nelumboides]
MESLETSLLRQEDDTDAGQLAEMDERGVRMDRNDEESPFLASKSWEVETLHEKDEDGELKVELPYEQEQSPVEEVALTVPTTDDPYIPVVTFRMWTLGLLSCIILSILNQFFWFRTEPLSITAVSAQIAVLPLGRFMAATLPTRRMRFPGTNWHFTLNPGPFNMKEHVLITIFANAGAGSVYAIHIVTIVKIFYKKTLNFVVAFIVVFTTQILGFGWAGIFRTHLVEPATMWWPSNLVQVSLFRALHEKDKRPKGSLSRNQFFALALMCSFAYYVFPGYLIPMLTSISWLCWVYPQSVFMQQMGSGLSGLGLGAIGLDWSAVSSYLGSPLASPWFAIANVMAGFVLVVYIITPLAYFFNIFQAKTFPIFSDGLFTASGQHYNISKIINDKFQLDETAYLSYGRLHLSTFFVFSYGVGFAALSATLVHVMLFHGKDILQLSKAAFKSQQVDIHTRLMRRYKQVPQWWFLGILAVTIAVAIGACQTYSEQLQLPWWGVAVACIIAFFFTLPIGIIRATTNQSPGLNIITEYLIGYLYPGHPVANVCFKVYGYISMSQALEFLQDFKLGHYMKIPPRDMFMAQVVGTVVAALSYLCTAWYMIENVSNICDTAVLPSNSPWTCPGDRVFFDASVIWGLIGPRRIFGDLGLYSAVNWFFLIGAIAPVLVWLLCRRFPNQKWIRLINMPVLIGATGIMPPATAVNFTSWCAAGFIFSFIIFRYRKAWWQRYNYVLSGGLDAGLAFMGIMLYVCLGLQNVSLSWWGENLDNCPLASCPTASGIEVAGCPAFS